MTPMKNHSVVSVPSALPLLPNRFNISISRLSHANIASHCFGMFLLNRIQGRKHYPLSLTPDAKMKSALSSWRGAKEQRGTVGRCHKPCVLR